MDNRKNIMAQNLVIFIACMIIFVLIGVLASLFCSKCSCMSIALTLGILIGIFIILLRLHNSIDFPDKNKREFLESLDAYANECYYEVKCVYSCRRFAAQRLMWSEFCIQTVNIYYSVFTAILAVFSLTPKSDFLQIPSVLFTITVAILVTYANAQKCGSRSKDLAANCSDLGKRYTEIVSLINSDAYKYACGKSHAELKEKMKEFYNDLGDSEDHTIVDEWKYTDSWLFYFYIAAIAILVFLLFIVPIGFIGLYHTEFIEIFKTVESEIGNAR